MFKVILVCMAGMSTNVMRGRIEAAAKESAVDMKVKAIGMDELDENLNRTDAVLLGPQIKYNEKNIRIAIDKKNPDIPMMVIESTDFGMMRGDLVFKKLMALLNK